MQNKVAPFAAARDSTYRRQAPSPSHDIVVDPQDGAAALDDADLRLVIEEDPATGEIVYKTINRATGEIVHHFRREEILRMQDDDGYAAGGLIRTKA